VKVDRRPPSGMSVSLQAPPPMLMMLQLLCGIQVLYYVSQCPSDVPQAATMSSSAIHTTTTTSKLCEFIKIQPESQNLQRLTCMNLSKTTLISNLLICQHSVNVPATHCCLPWNNFCSLLDVAMGNNLSQIRGSWKDHLS